MRRVPNFTGVTHKRFGKMRACWMEGYSSNPLVAT
jgi:hypothetical protein